MNNYNVNSHHQTNAFCCQLKLMVESRAWTIRKGWTAPQAAGVIHNDFERGFIRAETVSYDHLVECGSEVEAKSKGLLRSEGKDYIVQEDDVILFRFQSG